MNISEQEMEEFKTEARDLLDVAEKSLLALDTGEDFRTTFNSVFRSFHNLKGASGMMELTELQSHTHELENTLMGFKEKCSMPKNYVSFFLKGIDASRELLDGKKVCFDFNVNCAPSTCSAMPAVQAEPVVTSEPIQYTTPAVEEFLTEAEEIIERVCTQLRAIDNGNQAWNRFETVPTWPARI